jgi:hypothetical protein
MIDPDDGLEPAIPTATSSPGGVDRNRRFVEAARRWLADLERRREAASEPSPLPPCSWCGLAPVRVKRSRRFGSLYTDLCARCYVHMRSHCGDLPTERHNDRQRARLGWDYLPETADGWNRRRSA